MHFSALHLADWRCWPSLEVRPAAGINVLLGANGSGKTSILEAMYVLSHGRSFRGGGVSALVRQGAAAFVVHAETVRGGRTTRLGLSRTPEGWTARADGESLPRLADLLARVAVLCVEPGSQALVTGPAELRRRLLDWGLFHVEPGFLPYWQRYRRALAQRNAGLRQAARASHLAAWEESMDAAAQQLDRLRSRYLEQWRRYLEGYLQHWLPELGAMELQYQRGWPAAHPLAEVLRAQRQRDRAAGYTRPGPHRADWHVVFARAPDRHHLSGGQAKLIALASLLAQFELHRETHGDAPVLLLDDLASELDTGHFSTVIRQIEGCAAQAWITSVQPLAVPLCGARVFHVEHGRIRAA